MEQSINIKEIRELASRFEVNMIDQCMQLALENKDNPCYSGGDSEQIISVLAKTNFIQKLMQQGLSLSNAMRELGKRIRMLQIDTNE